MWFGKFGVSIGSSNGKPNITIGLGPIKLGNQGFINSISNPFKNLFNASRRAANNTQNMFRNNFLNNLKNLTSNVGKGLNNMGQRVQNATKGATSGIINNLNNIGKNLGNIGKNFQNNTKNLFNRFRPSMNASNNFNMNLPLKRLQNATRNAMNAMMSPVKRLGNITQNFLNNIGFRGGMGGGSSGGSAGGSVGGSAGGNGGNINGSVNFRPLAFFRNLVNNTSYRLRNIKLFNLTMNGIKGFNLRNMISKIFNKGQGIIQNTTNSANSLYNNIMNQISKS